MNRIQRIASLSIVLPTLLLRAAPVAHADSVDKDTFVEAVTQAATPSIQALDGKAQEFSGSSFSRRFDMKTSFKGVINPDGSGILTITTNGDTTRTRCVTATRCYTLTVGPVSDKLWRPQKGMAASYVRAADLPQISGSLTAVADDETPTYDISAGTFKVTLDSEWNGEPVQEVRTYQFTPTGFMWTVVETTGTEVTETASSTRKAVAHVKVSAPPKRLIAKR